MWCVRTHTHNQTYKDVGTLRHRYIITHECTQVACCTLSRPYRVLTAAAGNLGPVRTTCTRSTMLLSVEDPLLGPKRRSAWHCFRQAANPCQWVWRSGRSHASRRTCRRGGGCQAGLSTASLPREAKSISYTKASSWPGESTASRGPRIKWRPTCTRASRSWVLRPMFGTTGPRGQPRAWQTSFAPTLRL